MSSFVIEKNVPKPDKRLGVASKYPFKLMEIGDSFVVSLAETDSENIERLQARLAASGRDFLGRGGVSTRIADDRLSVRVWRVK